MNTFHPLSLIFHYFGGLGSLGYSSTTCIGPHRTHGYRPHPNAYRKITPRHKRGTRGRRDNHPARGR